MRSVRPSPLRLADRYLVGLMLPRTAAALAITLAALLLERVLRLVDFVTSQGQALGPVLGMAVNLLPHYLGLALPVAFCVGMLGALGRLCEDNEIDALESAGWSLRRIGLAFLGCAVGLSAVSLLLFGFVQPYSRYAYYEARDAVLSAGWDGRIEGGVFLDLGAGTVLSATTADAGGRMLYGVFLLRDDGAGETATSARRGRLHADPAHGTVHLVLEDGRSLLPDGGWLAFDRLVVPHEFDIDTGPFRPRGENARELTLVELGSAMTLANGTGDPDAARFAVEFHERLVRAVSLIGVALLSIPLGVARKRSPRWPRVALAVVALALYDNLIKAVSGLGAAGAIPPGAGLWTLAALFNGGALALYLGTPGQGARGPLRLLLRRLDIAGAGGRDADRPEPGDRG